MLSPVETRNQTLLSTSVAPRKNVVALFAPHMNVDKKIRGETVGLQYFEYTVTRFSNSFRLKPEHDGAKIRCVGSVGHGVDDVDQEVEVRVIGRSCWS